MNLTKQEERYVKVGMAGGLLVLYFLGVSAFGVSLVVPYAFLWLVYILNGLGTKIQKQNEELEKIAAR